MPEGIKGFVKGHRHSDETKRRIAEAKRGVWIRFKCEYCDTVKEEKKSHFVRSKRHFCSTRCHARYRKEIMPKEEQPRYGSGEPIEVKIQKLRCRQKFNHALRDKKIERQPCEVCGNPKSEGHHADYTKPLCVKWLCFLHHRQEHGQLLHTTPHLLEQKQEVRE